MSRTLIINGYEKTSLRKIALKCNISATALYRHFLDKEDIFKSVIKPFITKLNEVASYIEEKDYDFLMDNNIDGMWSFENDNNALFNLLFKEDKNLCKLIISERRGWFKEYICSYEYDVTLKYISKMKSLGLNVNEFDTNAFKILLNSYIEAYFDVIVMNLDDGESFRICKSINEFYTVGFRNLFGF